MASVMTNIEEIGDFRFPEFITPEICKFESVETDYDGTVVEEEGDSTREIELASFLILLTNEKTRKMADITDKLKEYQASLERPTGFYEDEEDGEVETKVSYVFTKQYSSLGTMQIEYLHQVFMTNEHDHDEIYCYQHKVTMELTMCVLLDGRYYTLTPRLKAWLVKPKPSRQRFLKRMLL